MRQSGLRLRLLAVGIVLNLIFCQVSDAGVTWRKYSYFQNWGGLNDQLSTTEINDNEATDIQNFIFDTGGALRKRTGFRTLNIGNNPVKVSTGTVVEVTGLSFYELNNGDRFLVSLANRDGVPTVKRKAYTSTGGPENAEWITIDGAVPSDAGTWATAYDGINRADFAIAENKCVFTIGVNTYKPYYFDGTNHVRQLTTDTDCPNATLVEYHKNHLFLSGNNTSPSRVWFSALDDITGYTATDFFDVQSADGTKVRALASAYDSLYIFKDTSIWRLSGWERDTFRLEKMIDSVGTLSFESVKVTDNGIFFATEQGDLCLYDGAYDVQFISRKIINTTKSINKAQTPYILGLDYSSYRFADDDYYAAIAIDASQSNNRVLLFDTAFQAWTKFRGINPIAWCVGDGDSSDKAMYFADYSGYVHRYPSTTFYDGDVATSAILSFYQTKWFRYPEVSLGDKYWRLLKTYTLSNSNQFIHAECKSDYEASGKVVDISLDSSQSEWDVDLWDVALWGGDTVVVGRNEIEKGKNFFQVRFYNNDIVTQAVVIVGWEMLIEPTERI